MPLIRMPRIVSPRLTHAPRGKSEKLCFIASPSYSLFYPDSRCTVSVDTKSFELFIEVYTDFHYRTKYFSSNMFKYGFVYF